MLEKRSAETRTALQQTRHKGETSSVRWIFRRWLQLHLFSVKFMTAVLVKIGQTGRPVRGYILQMIVGRTCSEILGVESNVSRLHTLKEDRDIVRDRRLLAYPTELIWLLHHIFDGDFSVNCPVQRYMGNGNLSDLWL
jgi:hypothetical protein